MKFENDPALLTIVSIAAGFFLSIGLSLTVCATGDHACRTLVAPAALVFEKGFEGGLAAFGATVLVLIVIISTSVWFVLRKWGPFHRVDGPRG